MYVSEYRRAIAFATMALRGTSDKAGFPLIDHAKRVADKMNTYAERTVAYLHDVIEDSNVLLSDLHTFFSPHIVAHVDTLTRREAETYFDYIDRVAQAPETARLVKIADLEDHLERSTHIPASLVRRYTKALATLRNYHSLPHPDPDSSNNPRRSP